MYAKVMFSGEHFKLPRILFFVHHSRDVMKISFRIISFTEPVGDESVLQTIITRPINMFITQGVSCE